MKPFNLNDELRSHIKNIKPYSSARHEFTGTAAIFLDANENPYPGQFNRYPDPDQTALKKIISEIKEIPVENIFLGNGSDEAIDLLVRAFCEPGKDQIITNPPTYGMYKVVASINNIFNREVYLKPDFSLPVNEILDSITPQTKIIFICSPNNPTGNSFPTEDLIKIIRESGKLVVVDEAYIDFSSQESLTALRGFPNLVVLQTLSKAYGMAGLRIGLAAGPTDIIKVLNCIKPPYNISSASINAAIEILSNPNIINSHREEIIREREKLSSELTSLEFVKEVFPGDANFLLVRVDDARSCYLFLKDNGIIVRDRSAEVNCSGCIRISIGTPNENQTLLETLKKFQSQNP